MYYVNKKKILKNKLLIREVIRKKHYSIRTGQEISECGTGVGVAIRVSLRTYIEGSP